jgi:hypothetical protein
LQLLSIVVDTTLYTALEIASALSITTLAREFGPSWICAFAPGHTQAKPGHENGKIHDVEFIQ